PPAFRRRLREGIRRAAALKRKSKDRFFKVLEKELTRRHAQAVAACLKANRIRRDEVALIGFHGQTVFHDPKHRQTWQLGDGKLLARLTGIDVAADFRANDMRFGGEGAPLAPLYHRALFANYARRTPLAVLNLGGVANVTWLCRDKILAFDCGPGNALLDDWVLARAGKPFDRNGRLAAAGRADRAVVKKWLGGAYFKKPPPKSLDRNAFSTKEIEKLKIADGAATLAAFTVEAIAKARAHFPKTPRTWMVTGGGRRNRFLMKALRKRLKAGVRPLEAFGFNGDALEAEAFAFLAVRALRKLPLSLPETTGVDKPVSGGKFFRVRSR
ncbi:MAG TPA: anhydro-N-acetylmuramic acid kinase, partial [Sphingomonadales bacterium]|nr:anhydro-N-acetylmuramic acid kinase [Sphingomonadales bacterium]